MSERTEFLNVPFVNGLMWDCPGCGQLHLQRLVKAPKEIQDALREEAEKEGAADTFNALFEEGCEMAPDRAVCVKCGAMCYFDLSEDDDEESAS